MGGDAQLPSAQIPLAQSLSIVHSGPTQIPLSQRAGLPPHWAAVVHAGRQLPLQHCWSRWQSAPLAHAPRQTTGWKSATQTPPSGQLVSAHRTEQYPPENSSARMQSRSPSQGVAESQAAP